MGSSNSEASDALAPLASFISRAHSLHLDGSKKQNVITRLSFPLSCGSQKS